MTINFSPALKARNTDAAESEAPGPQSFASLGSACALQRQPAQPRPPGARPVSRRPAQVGRAPPARRECVVPGAACAPDRGAGAGGGGGGGGGGVRGRPPAPPGAGRQWEEPPSDLQSFI